MASTNAAKNNPNFRVRSNGRYEYRKLITHEDGTKEQRSFYGKTKSECIRKYEDYLRNDKQISIKRSTLRGFADRWSEVKSAEVSYRTWKNYDNYLNNYVLKILGEKRQISTIKPMDISKMMGLCSDLSDSAKHHILLTANQLFKAAVRNGYCQTNPCEGVKYRKTDELKELEVFSREELAILISHLEDAPIGVGIALMLYAGLRTEEVCGLRWCDVDLENDIIKVTRVVTITEKQTFAEVKTTKSKRIRHVPIPEHLHEILVNSERIPGVPYVVPYRPNSKPYPYRYAFYTSNVFYERYEDFFKKLPIRFLSPHKLRHTYGTYLIRSGANLPSVQKLLGHSSVNTTRLYTDVDITDQKEAVSKLSFD